MSKQPTYILEINKMQYIAHAGNTIATKISPTNANKQDSDITVNLLGVVEGEEIKYGKPYIEADLKYTIGDVLKGDKVKTLKYKSKSRYRKTSGHRPKFVEFKLESVKIK